MKSFKVQTEYPKSSSNSRTIRFKSDLFDQLERLSEVTGVKMNRVVNQCIEYALNNLDEEEKAKLNQKD